MAMTAAGPPVETFQAAVLYFVPRTIVSLVKYLEAQGNELAGLEIATPSLEDVFLELTGRRLRD